jgi:hypothetical protein
MPKCDLSKLDDGLAKKIKPSKGKGKGVAKPRG